ncbi:hypothetical protein JTB14_009688 [Gonioctena quinquepunctata]|nr:hypothetical protein JTB14_009688 [Gonioctena quinquepunctata]
MEECLEKRAAIFKEGQKSMVNEKLKKERETAKRTPSVAAPPRIESDYEDEYFSHLPSIESEEESEQKSERFQETEKILRKIAEDKNIAQNLPEST